MTDQRDFKVVDLFAGPGGLGEGFNALQHPSVAFKSILSIEMEPRAHATLQLRAFVRLFPQDGIPDAYYDYIRGDLARSELAGRYQDEWDSAVEEAQRCTIGDETMEHVDSMVEHRLGDADDWILIGGPPCQAYSLVGRARRANERRVDVSKFESDHRHRLYEYYLRILATHRPTAFVMENVKGILSTRLEGRRLFDRILQDLAQPGRVFGDSHGPEYDLHTLAPYARSGCGSDASRFVLKSEHHGIPQRRHRVIVVGLRKGSGMQPAPLAVTPGLNVHSVVGGLPVLRGGVSLGGRRVDSSSDSFVRFARGTAEHQGRGMDLALPAVQEAVEGIRAAAASGRLAPFNRGFVPSALDDSKLLGQTLALWLRDERLGGFCNHESRSHMASDLQRYLFAAAFAQAEGRSPKLADFPQALLPAHGNANDGETTTFVDRFRVQVANQVATTITCHIAKDGHYYIHYDPMQCRSLSVREAARIQTFPDNYFFEGNRTSQYTQVGNAVPPLLARQIAERLADAIHGPDPGQE